MQLLAAEHLVRIWLCFPTSVTTSPYNRVWAGLPVRAPVGSWGEGGLPTPGPCLRFGGLGASEGGPSPGCAMSAREGAPAGVGSRPLRDSFPSFYASQTNVAGAWDAGSHLSGCVGVLGEGWGRQSPHIPVD
ncbi:hypothetical protein HJG60_011784 [Phyllostomus discolor]|uniref:Uncharacterized protein n=1 Tax=Phyllostomus discolor TaxID=89673 RepID=A0A833ZIY9_9CHIR|nr:hypothetical protein HJG60_011784 [Phyllostomus discolor]